MELGSGIITFVFVALCCLSAALGFEVTLIRSSCTQNLPYFRELESEGTECYRLFHGATQGAPGLTVDKYGPQLLLQTFREKPDREEIDRIAAAVMQAWAQEDKTLPPLDTVIWRHRGKQVETFVLELGRERELSTDVVGKELGLRYDLSFQLQRRDPLLYLDFRVVRRWLRSQDLAGKSVLNLFAYTCGASVAALAAGAARVASVDFSETALAVGRRNVALNALPADRCEWVCADALPALRQYAGLPVGGRRGGGGGRGRGRGGRRPPFARVPGGGRAGQFDLVVLDPPTWATSAFGAVDIRRDYPALFKPAVLAARPGGRVLATNHLAAVGAEEWVQVLERCAAKAGRPLRSVTMMEPEADFPSPDGRHPLKIALCEV